MDGGSAWNERAKDDEEEEEVEEEEKEEEDERGSTWSQFVLHPVEERKESVCVKLP